MTEKSRPSSVVRLAATDLDGSKPIKIAMLNIRGVSLRVANSLLKLVDIDPNVVVSEIPSDKMSKLEEAVKNPNSVGIPQWMLNRRRDPETGEDNHLIGNKLNFAIMEDVNRMKKAKSYKGVRHEAGLPVRGQKTRTSFRGKNSTAGLGVKKTR